MTGHRYLVLVSRGGIPTEAQIDEFTRRSGLSCYTAEGRVTILADRAETLRKIDGGYLCGTLFHRYGSPRAIDRGEPLELGGQPASRLLARFWGSYVAVFVSAESVTVLRDPSGAMPAHYAEIDDFVFVASDAALLHDVGAIKGEIDYEVLARHIFFADMPLTAAPLAGVRRLSPGTALVVAAKGISCDILWNPWDHAKRSESGASLDEAAIGLSRCVEACVRSWASCFSSILVGVSGGLDSSIVTACLAGRAQALTALTLVARDRAGDERPYARALCEHLDLNLLERFYALADIDPSRSCVSHLAFPSGRTQSQAYNAAVERAMGECGAEAFFTGNGGDNVFFLSQSTRGLIDRRRSGATITETWQSLRDLCALTGCSVVAAIRQAHRIARGPARYAWRPDPRFLSAATKDAMIDGSVGHPWLDAPMDALPGKAAHIAMILRIQNHVEGFDRTGKTQVVNPLLSQPILEQVLATPTWLCTSGGQDRSVARQAFRDRLPAMVADRRVKGGPDGFAAEILEAHLPKVRERLLGGRLADAGIIDLQGVEAVLRPNAGDRGASFVPLLFFLDIEAWIEHWTSRSEKGLERLLGASAEARHLQAGAGDRP